jgi:predicted Zn finger-like uncharacterized protein
MIVTCPSCSTRYRVRDDKIQGKGARISCPKCGHRFVVYGEAERFVSGDESPRGMPVTIRKQGTTQRAEVPEDDEAEAPTTVMAHGSAAVAQLRAALHDRPPTEEVPQAPDAPSAPAAPAPTAPPKPSGGSERLATRVIVLGTAAVIVIAIAAAVLFLRPM